MKPKWFHSSFLLVPRTSLRIISLEKSDVDYLPPLAIHGSDHCPSEWIAKYDQRAMTSIHLQLCLLSKKWNHKICLPVKIFDVDCLLTRWSTSAQVFMSRNCGVWPGDGEWKAWLHKDYLVVSLISYMDPVPKKALSLDILIRIIWASLGLPNWAIYRIYFCQYCAVWDYFLQTGDGRENSTTIRFAGGENHEWSVMMSCKVLEVEYLSLRDSDDRD